MSEETPDAVSVHSVSEAFEHAVFTLMLEHFGEEVGGTRSINSDRAVIALLPIASQLMASWSPKLRREFMRAFEKGTDELSKRLRSDYAARASAAPQ